MLDERPTRRIGMVLLVLGVATVIVALVASANVAWGALQTSQMSMSPGIRQSLIRAAAVYGSVQAALLLGLATGLALCGRALRRGAISARAAEKTAAVVLLCGLLAATPVVLAGFTANALLRSSNPVAERSSLDDDPATTNVARPALTASQQRHQDLITKQLERVALYLLPYAAIAVGALSSGLALARAAHDLRIAQAPGAG